MSTARIRERVLIGLYRKLGPDSRRGHACNHGSHSEACSQLRYLAIVHREVIEKILAHLGLQEGAAA